jgi:hypothetical protein
MSGHGKSVLVQELAFVRRCLAAVTLSLLALGSAAAGAAVRVDVQSGGGGGSGGVVVNASGATVAEILTALGETGDLHYRSSVDLGRTVSGTYKGTLQQVVSRLLEGYNFTLQVSDNRIEAVIIGLSGTTPTTGQPTTAVAAASAADAATTGTSAEPAPTSTNATNGGAANVAVRPNARRPQSASPAANLALQLRTAAQLQVMNGTTSAPAPAASSNPPTAADMAALTQQARTQLNALVSSLQSVKP